MIAKCTTSLLKSQVDLVSQKPTSLSTPSSSSCPTPEEHTTHTSTPPLCVALRGVAGWMSFETLTVPPDDFFFFSSFLGGLDLIGWRGTNGLVSWHFSATCTTPNTTPLTYNSRGHEELSLLTFIDNYILLVATYFIGKSVLISSN